MKNTQTKNPAQNNHFMKTKEDTANCGETTSISISGVPVETCREIRKLAADETRGNNSKMSAILLQEAVDARKARENSGKN